MKRSFRGSRIGTPGSARTTGTCACVLLAVLCVLAGCRGEEGPRVVSAEFLDDGIPDGIATQDEQILLTLDRPVPPGFRPESVVVTPVPQRGPSAPWAGKVIRGGNPRALLLQIVTGTPSFCFEGVCGRDPEASGLRVDLGDGTAQIVDLQLPDWLPVLEQAIWVDGGKPAGNCVVDEGDTIRLVFDRPVRLNVPEGRSRRVRSPGDIILSKAGDRLDDGEVPATWQAGGSRAQNEILIRLGSRPVLTVSGILEAEAGGAARFQPDAPSGLALSGTRVLPMTKIVDRRGGRGSISLGETDIEYAEGFPLPRAVTAARFPPPGPRIFHTLTPVVGGRAVLIGGATPGGREALDQVLVFDPFYMRHNRKNPVQLVADRLPVPVFRHSATLLPGPDGVLHTQDDVILVAGGEGGSGAREESRTRGELTVVRLRRDGGFQVLPLRERLLVARSDHAAVALPGNRVLIDGGRSHGGESPSGIVGCGEIISLSFKGDVPEVAAHSSFRSLPRMQHSLTLLSPGPGGMTYVLAYGGYGQPLKRILNRAPLGRRMESRITPDLFFSWDEGSVLVSPVLLNVDAPTASVWGLDYDFSFALLRYGHVAVPVPARSQQAPIDEKALGADEVLLAGGTLRHPIDGFFGGTRLWEMPLEVLPDMPQGHEAASPVLFRWNPLNPRSSTLEIFSHPSPDPVRAAERTCFSTAAVKGSGVFIAGGEQSGSGKGEPPLATGLVWLEETERLEKLAVRLTAGRARHRAYFVDSADLRSIFLLGGTAALGGGTGVPDVEEIPLP